MLHGVLGCIVLLSDMFYSVLLNMYLDYAVKCFLIVFTRGSISEKVGLLSYIFNLTIILCFPMVVVLKLPSITPGETGDFYCALCTT